MVSLSSRSLKAVSGRVNQKEDHIRDSMFRECKSLSSKPLLLIICVYLLIIRTLSLHQDLIFLCNKWIRLLPRFLEVSYQGDSSETQKNQMSRFIYQKLDNMNTLLMKLGLITTDHRNGPKPNTRVPALTLPLECLDGGGDGLAYSPESLENRSRCMSTQRRRKTKRARKRARKTETNTNTNTGK